MDFKLELVGVAVTDIDRAKTFYTEKAGFNADFDQQVDAETRFVQLTPPGSACSIYIGTGQADSPATPGKNSSLQLVVASIEDAHAELKGRGLDVSEIEDLDWGRFVYFADPDGNRWAVQELPDYSKVN